MEELVIDPDRTPSDPPEPIPISALQHWSYCERQCGLIHLEQTFDENLYTLRGRRAHERVDLPGEETRRGVRVERALPLWSRHLGLTGRADVVEFIEGRPYPVEYKVGARKAGGHDELQLCAQALCLEEMFSAAVPCGALYYYATRRRYEVDFDPVLRARVVAAIAGIRRMYDSEELPPAPNDARCLKCSLIDSCMPGVVVRGAVGPEYEKLLFNVDEPA